MDADEHIGLHRVGQLGALIQVTGRLPVPGEHHVVPLRQQDGLQLLHHGQGEILLIDLGAGGVGVHRPQGGAVVARVQHHGVFVRVDLGQLVHALGGDGGDPHPAAARLHGQVAGVAGAALEIQHHPQGVGHAVAQVVPVLGVAHAVEHLTVHGQGHLPLRRGLEHRPKQIDGHPAPQIHHPVLGGVVGGQGEHLALRVKAHRRHIAPIPLGGLHRLGGGGLLRLLRRGLRFRLLRRGDHGGGEGVVVPGHRGPQALGDEAQGHHGALLPLPFHHPGGDAVGQGRLLAVDQGGGGAQGEDDGALPLLEDHLPGVRHPGDRGPQALGDEPDGHQGAAVLPRRVLHQGGHIQGVQGRAVQGQVDPVGAGQRAVAAGGLVIEVDGQGAGGPGGPGGGQPGEQAEQEQEGQDASHGRTPRRKIPPFYRIPPEPSRKAVKKG